MIIRKSKLAKKTISHEKTMKIKRIKKLDYSITISWFWSKLTAGLWKRS